MKKITIFASAVLLVASIFSACKKNDGPTPFDLTRVPQMQITKVAETDQVIDVLDLEGFEGRFTVNTYYSNGIAPEKVDIVIIKNAVNASVKVLKADVSVFPSEHSVTSAELVELFGEPIELGDRFDIGGDVYIAGRKFQAFPSTGTANGGGIASQPGASPFTRYSAICAYDPSIYQGDFEVVKDEWQDYAEGDIVSLAYVDDTHVSFMYNSIDPKPIVVEIKSDNSTFVAKQLYGNYGPPYGDFSAESVTSFDNYVAPCEKTISVRLRHTSGSLNFGEATFTLKKVE